MDEALYGVLWFCDENQGMSDPQVDQIPSHGEVEALSKSYLTATASFASTSLGGCQNLGSRDGENASTRDHYLSQLEVCSSGKALGKYLDFVGG